MTTKSKVWIGLGFGLALLLAGRSGMQSAQIHHSQSVDSQPQNDAKIIMPKIVRKNIPQHERALYDSKRPAIEKNDDPIITKECFTLWNEMRDLDLNEVFQQKQTGPIPALGNCGQLPGELAKTHNDYIKSCNRYEDSLDKPLDPVEQEEVTGQCYSHLVLYRAQITDWITQNEKLEDISDPNILADKMIARFYDNPENGAEVAERLLEVEPGVYSVARTAALGRLLAARKSSVDKVGDPIAKIKKFESSLENVAETLSSESPEAAKEVRQMMGSIEMLKDDAPQKVSDFAREWLRQEPDSTEAKYFLSWSAYQNGDDEAAIAYLNEALLVDPNNMRIKETLRRAEKQKGKERIGLHQFSYAFPLDAVAPKSN